MTVRIVQLGRPRVAGEGLRIGTVRRPPRGVPKSETRSSGEIPTVRSFAPVAHVTARILILGSMPGKESLRMGQYYAHPRNLFWPILGELAGAGPALPYDRRMQALKRARIALWDVLESCDREGSLDSRIERGSLVANDFRSFFLRHPKITHVFFNGAKAEACYRTRVLPHHDFGPFQYLRLPSTSPANAGIPYERKIEAWRAIRPHIRQPRSAGRSRRDAAAPTP